MKYALPFIVALLIACSGGGEAEDNSGSETGCPKGCITPKDGCEIKGNISQTSSDKIYHVRGGEFYSATQIVAADGERWFCTRAEAEANGWRASQR